MNKPKSLEIGQLWIYKTQSFSYIAKIIELATPSYAKLTVVKPIHDNYGERPIGYRPGDSTLLTSNNWTFVSGEYCQNCFVPNPHSNMSCIEFVCRACL